MTSPRVHKILGVGPRCADWLKRQYPRNRGKLIALDFKVHENTAWRWLSGVAPTTAHLEEMFVKWGRSWLEFVFIEAYERSDPRLVELDDLDAKIRESARRAAAAEDKRRVAGRVEKTKLQRTKFQLAAPPVDPKELRRRQLLEGWHQTHHQSVGDVWRG